MTDQQIRDAIRGFLKAITEGEVKKALTFLAEDAVWTAPQGTFKGVAQIEKLVTWTVSVSKDNKVLENGIGIITQGDTGVIEHKLSGMYNGMKWEVPAVCIYEFKNGKMTNIRGFYDTLSQAQQASKGFNRWVANAVAKGSRKGLS